MPGSLSKLTLLGSALVACATAFTPTGISPIHHNAAIRSASCPVAPSNMIRTAKVSLRQGASTTDWAELPDGQKPFAASERTVDEWIEKFKDSRNSMRTVAAKMVAAMYDEEGKVNPELK
jgi:hypothetical protein